MRGERNSTTSTDFEVTRHSSTSALRRLCALLSVLGWTNVCNGACSHCPVLEAFAAEEVMTVYLKVMHRSQHGVSFAFPWTYSMDDMAHHLKRLEGHLLSRGHHACPSTSFAVYVKAFAKAAHHCVLMSPSMTRHNTCTQLIDRYSVVYSEHADIHKHQLSRAKMETTHHDLIVLHCRCTGVPLGLHLSILGA